MNAPTAALVAPRPERLRLVGQRRQILSTMHQRLMLAMLLYLGIVGLIGLRILYLAAFGDQQAIRPGVSALLPQRGDIVDREGQPLARTINAWSIGIHPGRVIGDRQALARRLAELIPERDERAYFEMLGSGRTFVYLRRRASPDLVEAVNALGEPGIALDREPERLYPQLSLASSVIGFTDIDGKGSAGIERVFDQRLSAVSSRGEPVQLSLSSRVQQALEHELASAMTTFSAIGAAGVVMDIHSGEILAMTSLPQVNPNRPGRGTPDEMFNRATLGVYELGSTFKPFTVAMAMDAGTIESMGKMYDCPKQLRAGRFTITDTHPFNRACSVAEIMAQSSNIGTAVIAAEIGAARQRAFLQKMGFLSPIEIELLERGRTLSPGSNWGEIATMTVGYGHGIAVTPLHLASGYATLFNGGLYRPATLLKVGPNHPVPEGRRVFSADTSYKMRSLMRLVVTHGTGRKADAPGYRVGGKTGSAEKYHNRNLLVTTFAGVFPMDDPRYVVVVMLDEPKGTPATHGFRTAGWNVAPVVSKTVARIAPMLGITPDRNREPDLSEVLPYIRPKDK
jgi:cell division protein FtsI (penicillin-binding protein 3)